MKSLLNALRIIVVLSLVVCSTTLSAKKRNAAKKRDVTAQQGRAKAVSRVFDPQMFARDVWCKKKFCRGNFELYDQAVIDPVNHDALYIAWFPVNQDHPVNEARVVCLEFCCFGRVNVGGEVTLLRDMVIQGEAKVFVGGQGHQIGAVVVAWKDANGNAQLDTTLAALQFIATTNGTYVFIDTSLLEAEFNLSMKKCTIHWCIKGTPSLNPMNTRVQPLPLIG